MAANGRGDKYPPAPHPAAAGDSDDPDAGSDGPGGTVPRSGSSTVYVDLPSGEYHADESHATADPAAFTRKQADRFGYSPCGECFDLDLGDRDGSSADAGGDGA